MAVNATFYQNGFNDTCETCVAPGVRVGDRGTAQSWGKEGAARLRRGPGPERHLSLH